MHTPAQAIYPITGIRAIEQQASTSAKPSLMERAGRAAAEEAIKLSSPGPILIACGPGNNGGDGFVMARYLREAGRQVHVAFAGKADKLPPDAKAAFQAWQNAGGKITTHLPAPPQAAWAMVVDALFGIGLERPLTGQYGEWIEHLNAQHCLRLAIDIPSGLDADSGNILGMAFRASHTLTFIAIKPGLLILDGPDYAGSISVHGLDINPLAYPSPSGQTITPSLFSSFLRPRRRNTHKGCYGDIGIIGGAAGMSGAALMAGRAALRLGAGRVFVGLLDPGATSLDFVQPELMLRAPQQVLEQTSILAVGPGLGCSDAAHEYLEQALTVDRPLVLDADALNLLASQATLRQALLQRKAPSLLTPHPGEAARLLNTNIQTVQLDRLRSARELAHTFQSIVLLKGCGSIISTADGRWFINQSGHPGMASAGMGDVLSGLLASLLGQGWSAESALLAAVNLHGAAADCLAKEGIGPIGLTACEVIDGARRLFNDWLRRS